MLKIINVITGGSNICGLTYSTATRHAKECYTDKPTLRRVISLGPTITFD